MQPVKSMLITALITPLALASPHVNALNRRTGDDETTKDTSLPALSTSLLPTSSSVPAKDQTSSSFESTKDLFSSTFAESTVTNQNTSANLTISLPVSPSPESTVQVLTTDVVYTTLTTCPVTNTVSSGTTEIQEVTTTVSTVTRTSISTVCTKCVAPPMSFSQTSVASAGVTVIPTLPSFTIQSQTQASTGLFRFLSKPEISSIGTGAPASGSLGFPNTASLFGLPTGVSLSVSATVGGSGSVYVPGYSVVPSPTSTPGSRGLFSNATSSIIPVFTPSLLGNGYGGGFVSTPSIYVTKLSFPYGPSEGVPPGYGFSSQSETFAGIFNTRIGNTTSTFTSLGLPTSSSLPIGNATVFAGPSIANVTILSPSSSFVFAPMSTSFPSSQFGSFSNATMSTPESVVSSLNALNTSGTAAVITSMTPLSLVSTLLPNGTLAVQTFPLSVPLSSGIGSLAQESASPSGFTSSVVGLGAQIPSSIPISSILESFGTIQQGTPTTPSFVGNSATAGQIVVETSTPSPFLISTTASGGEIIVETSFSLSPPAGFSPPPGLSLTTSNGVVVVPTSITPSSLAGSATVIGETVIGSSMTPVFISSTVSNGVVVVESSFASPTITGSSSPNGESFINLSATPIAFGSSTASNGVVVVESSFAPATFTGSPSSNGESAISSVATLITLGSSTASNGMVVVETSLASQVLVSPTIAVTAAIIPSVTSYTASSGEIIVMTSTPSPVLVSYTATTENALVGTPGSTFVGSATSENGGSQSLSIIGTPIETGVLESPTTSLGQGTSVMTLPTSPSLEQAGQPAPTILTPVVGANGLTSLAVVSIPGGQLSSAGQPVAPILTPIAGANGATSIAVVPSPVVGANGLTSLAVFSTPIVAANGLTLPAVMLTPVVGPNGQTSLAVLATPVVGNNGLTSLAIGLAGDQGSSGTPSPIEEFIPATSPATALAIQPGPSNSPIVFPPGASGSTAHSISLPPSTGGGSNSSVHVSLNPSSVLQFEASSLKLSVSFGVGLTGFFVFLLLL